MGNFVAGWVMGSLITAIIIYQIGWLRGRKAMRLELKQRGEIR